MPETPLGTYIGTGTTKESWLAEFQKAGYTTEALVELTIDERTGEDEVNWETMRGYVQAAEKEFEFFSGQRYSLPLTLSTSADFLRDIMRRRAFLWPKIQNGKLTEDQRAQSKEDHAVYRSIMDGGMDIVASTGETAPSDGAGSPGVVLGGDRVFTSKAVDGSTTGRSELDMM